MRLSFKIAAAILAAASISAGFWISRADQDELARDVHAIAFDTSVSTIEQQLLELTVDDVQAIRGQICARGLPKDAYRQVDSAPSTVIPKRDEISVLNDGTWQMSESWGEHNIGNPIDWNAEDGMNRSERFAFHSWRPLKDVLVLYSHEGEADLLDWSISQSLKYADGRFFANNDYRVHKSGDFTWYDMAVGLRARFLAVLLHGASCKTTVNDADFELLYRFAADHVKYLVDERYYVSHNNHGAYQSFGLVYLCSHVPEIPTCEDGGSVGEVRLKNYFVTRVADGILLEHSPSYQVLLIQMLGQFLESPEVFSESFVAEHEALLRNMLASTDIFLTSNNTFVQFGDTGSPVKNFGAVARACLSLMLERDCITSDAASSVKEFTENRVKFFAPKAGYAGFRQPAEFESTDGTYLMLSAAFHSRVHKHSDDLSFVWSDLGFDILTDAGLFGYSRLPDRQLTAQERELGYYYSDPKRIYVESIHAHNTVEIDGISPPRAKVPFFGAGELDIREEGELIIVRGTVPRYDTEGGFHTRWLVSKPGSFLLVQDHLSDNSTDTRQFTVWHHFKPTFQTGTVERGRAIIEQPGLSIEVWPVAGRPNDIRLVRGQEEPRLQGWRSETSKQLTASFALGVDFMGEELSSAIVFSLNGAIDDVQVTRIPNGSRYSVLDASGEHLEFSLVE